MLNDVKEILSGVPATYLDPVHLVSSQSKTAIGFIAVLYKEGLMEGSIKGRFFDLFFFKDTSIYEYTRLNQDLRFAIEKDSALETFDKHRTSPETILYLFETSEEIQKQFRSTFYFEPCLKVHVQSLTSRQLKLVLQSTHCTNGILECNEFLGAKPTILLSQVSNPEQLLNFKPALKHGRILLYDVDMNRDIIKTRYPSVAHELFGMAQLISTQSTACSLQGIPSSPNESHPSPLSYTPHQVNPDLPGDRLQADLEAQEFSNAIQKILNAPMSTASASKEDTVEEKNHKIIIQRREIRPAVSEDEEPLPPKSDVNDSQTSAEGDVISSQERTSGRKKRKKSPTTAQTQPNPGEENSSTYLRHFERLYRSFRQQVIESCGKKSDSIIETAEQHVRILTPELSAAQLNQETYLVMLDLIEEIIRNVPYFKRSKIRQTALLLISDLYNKHYNELELHHAIDAVEQLYYRLKK